MTSDTEEHGAIETNGNDGPSYNEHNDVDNGRANQMGETGKEDDEEDDFGAFSDASFDDFEGQQDESSTHDDSRTSQTTSSFPQAVFSDTDELRLKMNSLVSVTFPGQLPTFQIPQDTSILNSRSEHLLERLIAPPHLKPYNWKRGSLRRQLLATLGLPDEVEEKVQRQNEFDIESYVIKTLKELNIDADTRKLIMDDTDSTFQRIGQVVDAETLEIMDNDQLDAIIATLEQQINVVERHLIVWQDEKLKLEEDHDTFETVVENLVGHTQRMRREETMKSIKKEKEKGKLNNLFKMKKKKLL